MPADSRLSCAGCGGRLGYYEPLRCRAIDGRVISGELLAMQRLIAATPDEPRELFHADCLSTALLTLNRGSLHETPNF
jgi:hypothetical protein